MKKAFLLFFALALVAPSTSNALPLLDIDVSVGQSMPAASGSINYGTGGSSIDLGSLNLGTGSDVIAKIDLNHAIPIIPNIYIHHLPVAVSGTATLGTVSFAGKTFTGAVKTEIDIKQDDIGLYYNVPLLSAATLGMLDAKFGLNARMMNFKVGLKSALQEDSSNFSAPIPMLYLAADFKPIHLISIGAEIKTLPAGSTSLTEWSAEVKVSPLPILYVGVGYSNYTITLDPSLVSGAPKATLTFAGPYAVLGAEF